MQRTQIVDTAETILRGKFTAANANIKKEERSQVSISIFPLEKLEKEEQTKPKEAEVSK